MSSGSIVCFVSTQLECSHMLRLKNGRLPKNTAKDKCEHCAACSCCIHYFDLQWRWERERCVGSTRSPDQRHLTLQREAKSIPELRCCKTGGLYQSTIMRLAVERKDISFEAWCFLSNCTCPITTPHPHPMLCTAQFGGASRVRCCNTSWFCYFDSVVLSTGAEGSSCRAKSTKLPRQSSVGEKEHEEPNIQTTHGEQAVAGPSQTSGEIQRKQRPSLHNSSCFKETRQKGPTE